MRPEQHADNLILLGQKRKKAKQRSSWYNVNSNGSDRTTVFVEISF